MFSLVPINYESGTVVLEQDSNADSLIFIEDGILEVYITLEGHEFILEKLHRGSVINFRAFFMQDTMYVNIRCQKYTKLLVLDQAKMNEIQNKYEGISFSNKILSYQNKILKKEQKFPLDYIMSIQSKVEDPEKVEVMTNAFELENRLKNVVMRIVIEIKERKKRPKLGDFIQYYKERSNQPGAKEEFQQKFLMLYGDQDINDKVEDKKFDKLMLNFDRIQKQLSQQQQALSFLLKRVNNLIERREKNEKKLKTNGTTQEKSNLEMPNQSSLKNMEKD